MAISDGHTEIPDSEDEPLTSSPLAAYKSDADELCVTDYDPRQDGQDAMPKAIGSHPAHTRALANATPASAAVLELNQRDASINVDKVLAAQTNVQGEMYERQAPAVGSGCADFGETNSTSPLDLHAGDPACRPETTVEDSILQGLHTDSVGPRANADKSSDINFDIDEYMSEIRDSHSGMHRPVNSPCIDSLSPPEQKPGYTKSATSIANYELVGEHAPKEACGAIFNDQNSNMGMGNPLHAWGDKSDDGNDTLQNHIAAQVPSHDVSVMARSVISGANDYSNNKLEAQDSSVDVVQPADLTSEELESNSGVYSKPHSGQQDSTDQNAMEEQASKASSRTVIDTTNAEVRENQRERQCPISAAENSEMQMLNPAKPPAFAERNPNTVADSSKTVAEPISIKNQHPSRVSPDPAGLSIPRSSISKSPQESTLRELKEQKAALISSLAKLPAIQALIEENDNIEAEADNLPDEPNEDDVMVAANKIVRDHIKLLHEYNELKDVGQGLMGLIADQRGVRIVEVQEEFGIEAKD